MSKIQVKIEGMTCQHCVKHVTEALQELQGVDGVNVSLEEKQALVETNQEIPRETINHAVEEAGYQVVDVVSA